MVNPKVRDEISDTSRRRRRQFVSTDNPVGNRILSELNGRDYAWLSQRTGIPASTISDYVQRGISRADNAVKIADALGISLDWLLKDHPSIPAAPPIGRPAWLTDAANSDWVALPEYDLRTFTESGKGEPLASTAFRRDWLNRTLLTDSGLWTTRLLSAYPPADLKEGEQVIVQDHSLADLAEGHLCLWGLEMMGELSNRLVGRYSVRARGQHLVVEDDGEYWVYPRLVGPDEHGQIGEDRYYLIGRILGRPLAPIR